MNYLGPNKISKGRQKMLSTYYFALEPNRYGQFLAGFGRLVLIVLLPLLAIYCGLLLTGVESITWRGGIMGISLLLLGGLFARDRRKANAKPLPCTLSVNGNQISLSGPNCPVRQFQREELTITLLGWGSDLNQLQPAIRLKGEQDLNITIGATHGRFFPKTIVQTQEATDFLLGPAGAWQELMDALKVSFPE